LRLSGQLAAAFVVAAAFGIGIGWPSPAIAANPCLAAASDTQDLRKENKLREARLAALTCSRPTCNSVVRASCERWLKEIDEDQPSLIVHPVESRGRDVLGARVTIDDTAVELDGVPVAIDPGPHVVRARARSGDVTEQKVLIVLKEKARVIEIRFNAPLNQDGTKPKEDEPSKPQGSGAAPTDPRPADPVTNEPKAPERNLVLPFALAGIGVVALGALGYFYFSGSSDLAEIEQRCRPNRCTEAQVDPVRSKYLGAQVALGVSVIAFAAAAIVYLTGSGSAKTPKTPTRGSALDLANGVLRF
jgi:hypothetical protein